MYHGNLCHGCLHDEGTGGVLSLVRWRSLEEILLSHSAEAMVLKHLLEVSIGELNLEKVQ